MSLFRSKKGLDLAYSHWGDSVSVLLAQHGMVATIKDQGLFTPLLSAGRSVLAVARPGYGDSSCYPLRDVAEYAEVVEELLDHLGVDRFTVLGSSSGAPYALAVAHRLPHRAIQTFVFSGTPLLTDPEVARLWPHPLTPGRSFESFQEVAREIFSWMEAPGVEKTDDLVDTQSHDYYGPALDLKIRCEDWGFPLTGIRGRVLFEHAEDDDQIPIQAAERTAALVPHSAFLRRKQGGHFSPETFQRFLRGHVLPAMPPV